jgi:DNA helicase II / ATP-dependent DNA helicase PcrA
MGMNYLDTLNEVQRNAVIHMEGPLLVVAGPGSGKTRVLTFRIAHLIENGVNPNEILSLTFTNKAAKEMKERIVGVVGSKGHGVWAGTFHSIFARILRYEAESIGFPNNFTIYDTEDSKTLIRNIIKELSLAKDVYPEGGVLSRISSAKSNLITPKMYETSGELMTQDAANRRPYIHQIYKMYMERCKKAGAMDFDDLLLQTYNLLQNVEHVRVKYQKRFKYLLVDEFQDTNYLQYRIIAKLINYDGSQHNICVVGDDAQSIYAFRGATIDNILDFEKDYKELKVYKLEQNYRSTHHIVQAANQLIKNNDKQIQKEIWTDKGEGNKIKLLKMLTDAEEAKRVADLILEHKNRDHYQNKEIAILYRTNAQSRPFEEALRRFNIPYKVYGGLSFYQRKEVKDLIGYLRFITNHQDEEAFRRIINMPKRGIGESTVSKITDLARDSGYSIWDALKVYTGTPREVGKIQDFVKMIDFFKSKIVSNNAYEVAAIVAKQSGIIEMYKIDSSLESQGRLENINALLDAISEFVDNDEIIDEATMPDKSITSYLQNIALVSDLDSDTVDNNHVTLMSVHSAKGLEFKSVFVTGMEENLFPSTMAMEQLDGLDEERRLFYVAVTRAELNLTLSYSASRYRYGKMVFMNASRFLEEIPLQHLDAIHTTKSEAMAERKSDENMRARISGNFSRTSQPTNQLSTDQISNFKASPIETIQNGMHVLHIKFGKGKVISIEGNSDNKIATIFFEGIDDPSRKIMLKFAKLQIVE